MGCKESKIINKINKHELTSDEINYLLDNTHFNRIEIQVSSFYFL
jgi:hypothetical protein